VATGPVVLPPLSKGLVAGKIRDRSSLEVPWEIFVEPVGIGRPGAYVTRAASRGYTREEADGLSDLGERSESKSGSCGVKSEEVNANAARYCIFKIPNPSRQHVEIGKHVKLGTAEPILPCAPRVTRFDSRKIEAGKT